MARFVVGDDRSQSTLFPERLDDYLGMDNPVRAIDVFVDELDLAKLGFGGVEPEATGRPAYHPATLLKIYVYGYLNRVQSSRRLERECQRNIELVWLTGRLMPDFKTIADFRKDNGDAIRKVCREFVMLCRRLELFSEASVAIDGSKFKAVNTRDRNFTQAKMERRLVQIDESIARYLAQLDSADRQGDSVPEAKITRLSEKIVALRQEIQRLNQLNSQMMESQDKQISLTDRDARSMATSGRGSGMVGYNVQSAVDTRHHLIVAHEVTNVGSDRDQLSDMTERARAAIGSEVIEVVADRGYYKGEEIVGVSTCHDGLRDFEAQRLRGLDVDSKLVACGLLERQLARFGTLEDAVGQRHRALETFGEVGAIRHKSAVSDEKVDLVHVRQPMRGSEFVDALAVEDRERVRDHENCVGLVARHRRKRFVKIIGLAYAQRLDDHAERLRRFRRRFVA